MNEWEKKKRGETEQADRISGFVSGSTVWTWYYRRAEGLNEQLPDAWSQWPLISMPNRPRWVDFYEFSRHLSSFRRKLSEFLRFCGIIQESFSTLFQFNWIWGVQNRENSSELFLITIFWLIFHKNIELCFFKNRENCQKIPVYF